MGCDEGDDGKHIDMEKPVCHAHINKARPCQSVMNLYRHHLVAFVHIGEVCRLNVCHVGSDGIGHDGKQVSVAT